MFFRLNTVSLALVLALVIAGAVALGLLGGRAIRGRSETHRESIGVVQGALLGFVGLLLAFGLTMAVGRYDTRRALVVEEANDIGTTYLRAQLLAEPARTASLELLRQYGDAAVALADEVPDSGGFRALSVRMDELQRQLWTAAGGAVAADPLGTAPKLYVEALNPMFDSHTSRTSSLHNRVPNTVSALVVIGSAIAVGLLALYLALLGRAAFTAVAAAVVIVLILFISFDLDRPSRGFIGVPAGPLVEVRASMDAPPAVGG